MGTEKTLSAVIQEKAEKIVGPAPPLDYNDRNVQFAGGRIIRSTKVKLNNHEGPDQIKIAVEVLDGQNVERWRLASVRNPNDPPTYSDLVQAADSSAQAAEIERFAAHRRGHHWVVFVGDYPDATKKHFRSVLELSQMASPDKQVLRLLVTHLPNTWNADHSFPLKSEEFDTHPPVGPSA
jgi:hypothetical protein